RAVDHEPVGLDLLAAQRAIEREGVAGGRALAIGRDHVQVAEIAEASGQRADARRANAVVVGEHDERTCHAAMLPPARGRRKTTPFITMRPWPIAAACPPSSSTAKSRISTPPPNSGRARSAARERLRPTGLRSI